MASSDPYGTKQNPEGYGYFLRIVHNVTWDSSILKNWWLMCSWDQTGYYIHREREWEKYWKNGQPGKAKNMLLEDMQMIGFDPEKSSMRELTGGWSERQSQRNATSSVTEQEKSIPSNFAATSYDMSNMDAWLRIASSYTPDCAETIRKRFPPPTGTGKILFTYPIPTPAPGQITHPTAGRGGEPSYNPCDFKPENKMAMIPDGAMTSKLYLEPEHRKFGFHGPDPGGYGIWTADIARTRINERRDVPREAISSLNPSHSRYGPWFCYQDALDYA